MWWLSDAMALSVRADVLKRTLVRRNMTRWSPGQCELAAVNTGPAGLTVWLADWMDGMQVLDAAPLLEVIISMSLAALYWSKIVPPSVKGPTQQTDELLAELAPSGAEGEQAAWTSMAPMLLSEASAAVVN